MGRLHLFEFCDQAWLPEALRRYMTEYLCFIEEISGKKLAAFAPLLEKLMGRAPEEAGEAAEVGAEPIEIIDLCSGPAGPWRVLRRELAERGHEVRVTLTDIAPAPDYVEQLSDREGLRYVKEPIDATAVPDELRGPRVIFNGLHHFRPAQARAVLGDAVRKGQPIGVFEMLSRRPVHVLTFPLIFLAVLVVTPLVRPFRWGRLFWTYLVPVVPLMVMWDGWVSALRVHSTEELQALVADLGADHYTWEIGEVASLGPPAPFLLGRPVSATGAAAEH
ncbi:hypothetical protein [Haliangium sp.]|uniref:hypothetical protein n=1 Tax=Haliangium sp. TaxID=2663208 RepID=UPI003D0AD066